MTKKNVEKVTTRKLIQVRGSLYVCIPKKWATDLRLLAGDIMALSRTAESMKVTPLEMKKV